MQTKRRGTLSDERAFTIIELVSTIVVISILASIVTFAALSQQRDSRDAARKTKSALIAEAIEKYHDENNEYPSVASLADQPISTVRQKLGISDEDILKLSSSGASTVPIVRSSPTVNQVAYIASTSNPANNDQCQNQANGYCDAFALQYKKESDNSLVAIQSRHGDSSMASQGPPAPSQPSVSAVRVNNTTVKFTVTGAACSTGTIQYKIRYNAIAATEGSMPGWSTSFWSNSPTREINPGASYAIYYQAIAQCITGVNGNASPASAIGDLGLRGDGQHWTAREVASGGTNKSWQGVAYGDGRFVTVPTSQPVVMTSTDGENWTTSAAPSNGWSSVTYGDGRFVAVAWMMSSTNSTMTSTNGISWTSNSAPAGTWQSVTYGDGRFVAVANDSADPYTGGTKYRSMTSTNGTTWTASANPIGWWWGGVTYGYSRFVAVGAGTAAVSTDGTNWTSYTAPTGTWRSVAYGNSRFVAVTQNKVMVSNYNGTTWTAVTPPSGDWQSVVYGNERFVAIGSDGKAMTSTDGTNWTSYTAPSGTNNIIFGNDSFITTGYGKVTSSP